MARLLRIISAIGGLTRLFSFAFLLPAVIALFYDDDATDIFGLPRGFWVFVGCFAVAFLAGGATRYFTRDPGDDNLRDKEAYLVVGVGWLILCVLAMIPFLATRTFASPIDAFFEAMSGLTTTGATVIPGRLEVVQPSVHIWRGFLQFIGGMGIIVLGVAVLARLTHGGAQLLQAETPGHTVTRIAPRLAHTARILWGVYAAFAGVLFVLMFIIIARHDFGLKVTFFEALMHTFTTIATGGFSNHTESIAFFDDWLLELVMIIFMLASGTNFTLHYYLLRGKPGNLLRDPEWRFYMASFTIVWLLISGILVKVGGNAVVSLRDAGFTTASMLTSGGFATADFDKWPDAARLLILMLMITGGTAGGTSGGMKHVRVLLLLKMAGRQFRRILHPRALAPVRLGGRIIQDETLSAVAAFTVAFLGVAAIGATLLAVFDPLFSDPIDAVGASISALSNMGPALGVVGPAQNYAELAPWSKVLFSFMMWFGRLEVFAALVVFTPRAWKY